MENRERIAGALVACLVGASGSVALHLALGLVLAPVPSMRVGVDARALLEGETPSGEFSVVATATVGGFYFKRHSDPQKVGQRLAAADEARAQRHLNAVRKQGPTRQKLEQGWMVTTAHNQLSAELVQRDITFAHPWPWRIGLISVAVGLLVYLLGTLRLQQHWSLLAAVLAVLGTNAWLLPSHAALVQSAVGAFLGRTTDAQVQLQALAPLYLAVLAPPFAIGVIAIMGVAMRKKT